MKITMFLNFLVSGFGIPNCVANLARCFAEEGNDATILTFRAERSISGVKIREVSGFGRRIPFALAEGKASRWFALPFIWRELRKSRPDIVNVDFTPLDWCVSRLKKQLGYKMVYTYYGAPEPELYEGEDKKEKIQRRREMFGELKKADLIISISEFLHKELKGETGLSSVVIPDGLDLAHFSPKPGLPNLRKDGPILLHVGRIVPHKGVDLLLDAFQLVMAEVPKAKLYIVGEETMPSYGEQIRKKASVLGDSVVFVGYVSDRMLPYFYSMADIFTCACLWEGSGTLLLEAQACGTPVVAFNAHSFPEVAVDGETGYLVPFRDVDAFAQAVLRLLKDDELRNRMSRSARKYAEGFDWRLIARRVLAEYQKIR